jgi:hypothetical protein
MSDCRLELPESLLEYSDKGFHTLPFESRGIGVPVEMAEA